jgi:hypothetical protein
MEPFRNKFENSIDQLRLFYSKSLFPILIIFEKKRKSIVLLLIAAVSLILLSLIWWLASEQFLIALLIFVTGLIPGFLFISKVREFKTSFKHNVINKLMEFFEVQNLLHSIQYEPYGKIPKSTFKQTNFIMDEMLRYQGEDLFKGKIYGTSFEICELKIQTKSRIKGKINTAFHGHFLKFNAAMPLEGKFWMFSKSEKSTLANSIKEYYRMGASPVEDPFLSKSYLIYQTPEFLTNHILTEEMKKVMEDWKNSGISCFIYASGTDILLAIRSTKNILEPNIFSSNKRFEKIRNLYQELIQMFGMIEAIEKGI